ncbi:TlpA family protein disulfide reductase [Bacteroides sp.]|uniref:TlpA family protein disulfide reductase n=1 Tax=Bacteroides sp. TaxID=29523 RepID=UPI003AB394CC
MKTYLCISIFSLFCILPHNQEKRNINVVLHLDNELSQIEQKVYLSSFCPWVSGSEQIIWDSIQIEKGQNTITLQAYAPVENQLTVTFSKEGPQALAIFALPKDTIELNVTYKDESPITIYKKAIKGEFHNYSVDFKLQEKKYWDKKHELTEDGKTDSLILHNQVMANFYCEHALHSDHPTITTHSEVMLRLFFNSIINADSTLSIRKYLLQKFPKDPRTALDHADHTMQTEKGIYSAKRLSEIEREKEIYKKSQRRVQKGERLNLNLHGLNGEEISLSSLHSKFIYIDVWASWCAPCRTQFPYIKKALKKYSNELKVYAISIDRNHNSWKKAIEKDSIQSFIHVIGTNNNRQKLIEIENLGTERIPRNFLLDNNCRIIAVDLFENQLIETLDSLSHL